MSGSLRNRPLRWFAAVYTADAFLEWFSSVALMVLVYERTGHATAAAGLLVCKQIAPALVIPFLGTTFERTRLGTALAVAFAAQAVALALVAVGGYSPGLFPLAALGGVAGASVRALLRTGIATTLDGADRRAANAFASAAAAVAGVVGPAAAAALVAGIGVRGALVFAAVATFLCAGPALFLREGVHAPAGADDAAPPASTPSRGASQLSLWWLVLPVAVLACVFAMDEPALLAYSQHDLHAGLGGYGAIFTAWGLGMTAGSVVVSRLGGREMLGVAAAATAVVAVVYLGLGVAPTLAVALFLAILGGAGNGVAWVAIVTAVQEATPAGQEARAATLLEAVFTGAPGVGIVLGGVLADLVSPRVSLMVPGVVALAVLFAGAFALRLRSGAPAAAPRFISSLPGGSA